MEALLPQMTGPTLTEIDQTRVSAMRFSETCARAISPDGAQPQSERDDSSDTMLEI
jgi:hypothetical protein